MCIKCKPASHASHAVHWRIIEKNTIKIKNSNNENINWTLNSSSVNLQFLPVFPFFFYRCLAWLAWLAGLQFVKTCYWFAVHFISSQKLSNCSAHFYKCHLHQRTNNCTYPRIIQPIPSAKQQHSVDKMQCRTREGSSQKLQKVHALWWVSCPSLSLSWLKGENDRTNSIN